jgi:hypothetical protein
LARALTEPANQFRLMLRTGAYWLLWSLRSLMPSARPGACAVRHLRLRWSNSPPASSALKTRVMLHLPSACPDQAIMRLALERLPRLIS